MGERPGDPSDVQILEAQLGVMRAIALAQARWQEVAAALAADAPLPLEGLTPDQELAVRNLQLRRLSPQDRDLVRTKIEAVEAALRRRHDGDAGAWAARG